MIVTEAQIIAGLIIKATGQQSANSCVTMGRVLQQHPARLLHPPNTGLPFTGFFGWEGTIVVSAANQARVAMLTGVGTTYLGTPDLSGLRGVDWEGAALPSGVILRAFMIENLGGTPLKVTTYTGGAQLASLYYIAGGATVHLSMMPGSGFGLDTNFLNFARQVEVMEPVRITALLEASD